MKSISSRKYYSTSSATISSPWESFAPNSVMTPIELLLEPLDPLIQMPKLPKIGCQTNKTTQTDESDY